jgi:hypothetical protein
MIDKFVIVARSPKVLAATTDVRESLTPWKPIRETTVKVASNKNNLAMLF